MRFRLALVAATTLLTTFGVLPAVPAHAAAQPAATAHADRKKHRLQVSVPSVVVRGRGVALRMVERPIRQHRLLRVWYHPSTGGGWRLAARARETKHGKARMRFTLPSTGTYVVRLAMARYKVSKHRHVKLRQVYRAVKVLPTVAPAVIAHRGGAAEAPENTIAAFQHAVAVGAQTLETDVQETADNKLILMHDATFARTTNVAQVFPGRQNQPIKSFRSDEVARLSVAGQPVPTFDQLLDLVGATGVQLLAEAKRPGSSPGIEQEMLDALRAHGLTSTRANERIVIESFDQDTLKEFVRLAPDTNVSPILEDKPAGVNPAFYGYARSITLEQGSASAAAIARLHAAGLRVYVWTVDDAARMGGLADVGADGIITDAPSLALRTFH